MAYENYLASLADPTRRAVFERLRDGPAAAGELARHFPVSRPAISQHLNALLEAGLVEVEKRGTRRIYSVRMKSLEELRHWIEGFWDTALTRYKEALERDE